MQFVWFWTFWHWSKESYRGGSLLRSPLHGVGSHWDEWYGHEASESDRQAVAAAGETEAAQRRFLAWLLFRWARETGLRNNRLAQHFVLEQLAQVAPFQHWRAFAPYRQSGRLPGIAAIVLAEKSRGEADDIRALEAVALPADATGPSLVAEGFAAESTELDGPRCAASSVLAGRGFWRFLLRWALTGRRLYQPGLRVALSLGWIVVGGLMLYLLFGPDPGGQLFAVSAVLVGLWLGLLFVAAVVIGTQGLHAWRAGKRWNAELLQSQMRLRMPGDLTLKGGSAGLPFCLNLLLALQRAHPAAGRRSGLWRTLFEKIKSESQLWAATGALTPDGQLKPVIMEAKLRALLLQGEIKHLLTPRQAEARQNIIPGLARQLQTASVSKPAAPRPPVGHPRFGFAAEAPPLSVHRCHNVAHALMHLGGLASRPQLALNLLAITLSVLMVCALPDIRGILLPPRAPLAVTPSSPSPYHLWVSLDTRYPQYFNVALESRYWANRRAEVAAYPGVNASVRAEIRLHRVTRPANLNEEDGIVWVERRHGFLGREFAPGERVGRYTFSYLNRLGYE